MIISLLEILLGLNLIFCSFIDKHSFIKKCELSDRIDYLTEYLATTFPPIISFQAHSPAFRTAQRQYPRGLKSKLLDYISQNARKLQIDMSMIEQVTGGTVEAFSNCCEPILMSPAILERTKRGKKERERLNEDLMECVNVAEMDLAREVARMFEDDDEGRIMNKMVAGMNEIDLMARGEIVRWPWLSDEGWTWPWILGLFALVILVISTLVVVGWFIHMKFFQTSKSPWGSPVPPPPDKWGA